MQKYKYFYGVCRKQPFFQEFLNRLYPGDFDAIGQKIDIYTNLAIFGCSPSKKHGSVGFRKFCLELREKSQKVDYIDACFFFRIFLKNRRFWLRCQCRNEFCMKKYPNKRIFVGFVESSHFFRECSYSLSAKKLIPYIL